MSDFPALTGFYKFLFLYLEPFSTVLPAFLTWFFPGASWFHHQLVPSDSPYPSVELTDARSLMAVWQLGNCYFLLGLISSLVFRAIRDALPNNAVAQERILGASLTALAIADVSHMIITWVALPETLRWTPLSWNATTHGNISFVILLLTTRLAWFYGVGRKAYYYGQHATSAVKSKDL